MKFRSLDKPPALAESRGESVTPTRLRRAAEYLGCLAEAMEAKMLDLYDEPAIREIQERLDRQANEIVVLKVAVAASLTASEDMSVPEPHTAQSCLTLVKLAVPQNFRSKGA